MFIVGGWYGIVWMAGWVLAGMKCSIITVAEEVLLLVLLSRICTFRQFPDFVTPTALALNYNYSESRAIRPPQCAGRRKSIYLCHIPLLKLLWLYIYPELVQAVRMFQ